MSEEPTVIILKDSIARSTIKAFTSFAMLVGTIWLGVYLQSSAMQWAGFILSVVFLAKHAQRAMKDDRLTIAQARAKLDELEKGGAA